MRNLPQHERPRVNDAHVREQAAERADLADLVHASHAPRTPTMAGIPSSQTVSSVRTGGGMSGDGMGRKPQRDFGSDGQHPVPGINHVDRVADAFDRRDRAELMQKLAEQKS